MPRAAGLVTLAAAFALIVLVGVPVVFILLQAVFPDFARGSFGGAFSRLDLLAPDSRLMGQARNTLLLAFSVMLGCIVFGLPIGILRGLFRVPGARVWDVVFLVPFLIPPFIAAIAWMMTLQPRG